MLAHADADSFFASVLLRLHPHLKGKPLIAVGMGGSCVIAATYEAKAQGVRTGMRLSEARKLAPGSIEMPSDFRETGIASKEIKSILSDLCPVIEQMSVDEWFLDLQSLVGGLPLDVPRWASETRALILRKTSLSMSVGVAPSKLLAKMASEYRKPGGITVVALPDIERFLRDRPVAAIPGIGPRRQVAMGDHHILTAWDYACCSDELLRRLCGKAGEEMKRELLGERLSPVSADVRSPQSVSRCRVFLPCSDPGILRAHLLKHIEYCVLKMRRWHLRTTEIAVWLRTADFRYGSVRRRLHRPTATVEGIIPVAMDCLQALERAGQRWNQLGFGLFGLHAAETEQLSLFARPEDIDRSEALQQAIDALHERFGRESITRAVALPVHHKTTKTVGFSIV